MELVIVSLIFVAITAAAVFVFIEDTRQENDEDED